MTTCLASLDDLSPDGTRKHLTCGRQENEDGTCDLGHHWSAIAAFRSGRPAPHRGDEWCGVPTLIGIAGLFGAVAAAGVAVAAVGIARAIGGRAL